MREARTQAHENGAPRKLPDVGIGIVIAVAIGSFLIDTDSDPDSDPEIFSLLFLFSEQSPIRGGAPKRMKIHGTWQGLDCKAATDFTGFWAL